jgi:NAD(P)-dependent dehydrogenase (short-subunit alcohol dehydrogenase family)
MTTRPVALVTGASKGIGRAIATALASDGFDLALMSRSGCALTAADVQAGGCEALDLAGSVAYAADRQAAMEQIRRRFGRLDVLVNNAGIAPPERADILEATEESFDAVLAVNLRGPYFLTQAAARWMIAQRAERRESPMCIVNVSSVSAYAASTNRGEYCISKAGVAMSTALWAARLAEHGIGVYEIRPGVIATEMTAGVKDRYDKLIAEGLTPIRRWGQPADVAEAVAVCAAGRLPFSTGEVINVDGGFHLRTL